MIADSHPLNYCNLCYCKYNYNPCGHCKLKNEIQLKEYENHKEINLIDSTPKILPEPNWIDVSKEEYERLFKEPT